MDKPDREVRGSLHGALDGPLRVLVVARWFPAHDDPARGSFVSDQVAALAVTGTVDVRVASFESVTVRGTAEEQEAQRRTAARAFGDAVAARPDALSPRGAAAPPGIAVARLPVVSGADIAHERERQADDHAAVLEPFARGPGGWDGRPDLVHAHTGYPDGAAAAGLVEALGCPLVITEHTSALEDLLTDPLVRERYVRALDAAARVIAVSERMAATLRGISPGVEARLRVIPNPVPLDVFTLPEEGKVRRPGELLWVGTRTEAKGIPTLLQAFALVRQNRPGVTLRMIGRSRPPELEGRWRALAAELGIERAVTFEPPESRAGVAAAMRRADLFVHPSRSETFGMVAAEALASGLPVVATRSGGVEGVLGDEPERGGALVPIDDAGALARAIDEALERRGEFDPVEMRRRAADRFGSPVFAKQLLDLYEEVLAGRNAGGRGEAAVPAGPTARPPEVVVGFNRTRASLLLGALPEGVRAALTLVTIADADGAALPEGLARTIEVDLWSGQREAVEAARAAGPAGNGPLARALRALRHPRLWRRSRWARTHPAEMRLLTAREAVRSALGFADRRAIGPRDLVCLDGYDVLAVEPLLGSGEAGLCPGTTRWLADQAQSRMSESTSAM